MGRIIKRVFVTLSIVTIIFIATIVISVNSMSNTEAGKVPIKTGVLLHAINHNLVTPDMKVPRIFAGKGTSTFTREMVEMPTSDGDTIDLRVYQPLKDGPHPIILYYHGGAFMEGYGDINTHDNIVRSLAARTNSVVIAVGYRVAPDHPFPTPIEDSYEALVWAKQHAELFNGDPDKIAVVGDSAGGNLATVVSLMARDRNGPDITAQALLYPLTTFDDVEFPSREKYDSGYYLLSRAVMLKAREQYTPDRSSWSSPYTSPLDASDLSDLPPALVLTAEFDPLRDEGEAYAELLAKNGNYVEGIRYNGVMHGFISFYQVLYHGSHGLAETANFLNNQLNGDSVHTSHTYELAIVDSISDDKKWRDQMEAYAIGTFLLGKQFMNRFE
ncbi:alpha/beta hydrolase [Alkalihalobacillus pseudalcaliphilus]|uniref:alpha/beta hydrolase n=1 Tax=Alkalihalobacillus pseudalcaliphilus TaxID=79884 RepID=UPI00064D8EE2|nr:alpha/beta hydrolase [Alkalihalobacillus pseudalcaliphilus]KMK76558.1 lipase [Alkalihalobacillus pseudalcaliphilus]